VSSTLVGLAVWNLQSCFCGAPSLTRGRVCNLQSFNGPSRAEPVTILYRLIWHSPNLEGQVPVFISPGKGALVIPPGIGFHLRPHLRLAGPRWRYSNPPPTWRARSPYIYPSGTGWSSPNSKPRYDRRSVNQYVTVPSARGFRGAPSEQISIRHQEGYIKAKLFMLPLGGLHVKHAVQRGIWVPTQDLLCCSSLYSHGKSHTENVSYLFACSLLYCRLFIQLLLSNDCFSGTTIHDMSKYTTILTWEQWMHHIIKYSFLSWI
jgi:hypothetical protein